MLKSLHSPEPLCLGRRVLPAMYLMLRMSTKVLQEALSSGLLELMLLDELEADGEEHTSLDLDMA